VHFRAVNRRRSRDKPYLYMEERTPTKMHRRRMKDFGLEKAVSCLGWPLVVQRHSSALPAEAWSVALSRHQIQGSYAAPTPGPPNAAQEGPSRRLRRTPAMSRRAMATSLVRARARDRWQSAPGAQQAAATARRLPRRLRRARFYLDVSQGA